MQTTTLTRNQRRTSSHLNRRLAAKGELYIAREEYRNDDEPSNPTRVTYGFRNLMIWDPFKQAWLPQKDVYYVTSTSFELASSEFWARWKQHINKRFGLSFLSIETTSTTHEN